MREEQRWEYRKNNNFVVLQELRDIAYLQVYCFLRMSCVCVCVCMCVCVCVCV